MNVFGFEFKTKEEREEEKREFFLRIFPKGLAQREEVEQALKTRLPNVDIKAAMFYYILVRDAMTSRGGAAFEEAAETAEKRQRMIKVTPEILETVRELMKKQGDRIAEF